MKVEGCVDENDENDVSADLFEAGEDVVVQEDSDEEVPHPAHLVRNTVDCDGEEAGEWSDVLACVDDEAPQDDENSCKFSAVPFL